MFGQFPNGFLGENSVKNAVKLRAESPPAMAPNSNLYQRELYVPCTAIDGSLDTRKRINWVRDFRRDSCSLPMGTSAKINAALL